MLTLARLMDQYSGLAATMLKLVELDLSVPFTAARARNAGFKRLRELAPALPYVQFIDGDCELIETWPSHALAFFDSHNSVGAACGRLRERHPERSIYNWLCDREWDGPTGEVRACGGNVMMRVSSLTAVKGFREDLIAGEEPELCVRLRAAGWRTWRLPFEMALHDAAILYLGQWWRRTVRNGYAFAQGANLHGATAEHHWVWESRRAWAWGVCLPIACLISGLVFGAWGWVTLLIYPLHILQKTARDVGPIRDRSLRALFFVLGHFAEGLGQIMFVRDRVFRRQAHLIEYK